MTPGVNKKMNNRVNVIAVLVIGVLVAGSFFLVMALSGYSSNASALVAVVHDGDGGVHELPLSQDDKRPITSSYGTNVVVVKDHEVLVAEADCDNQDCVHQGKIAVPGRQIICLPHKLWIEVVANGTEQGHMDIAAVNEDSSSETLDTLSR